MQRLKDNNLSLNVKKTELIIFYPKKTKQDYSVKLNDKRQYYIITVSHYYSKISWNTVRWIPVMDQASQSGNLKAKPNNWKILVN